MTPGVNLEVASPTLGGDPSFVWGVSKVPFPLSMKSEMGFEDWL